MRSSRRSGAALASRARGEAAKATKTVTRKMATDKRTAAAWKRASKEEKAAFQRKVYYDHVDKLYGQVEAAAKKVRTDAEAILKMTPKDAAAQARQRAAATMEATTEVNGRGTRIRASSGTTAATSGSSRTASRRSCHRCAR
jgi:hypothetical protein